jgi:hypothetical protein
LFLIACISIPWLIRLERTKSPEEVEREAQKASSAKDRIRSFIETKAVDGSPAKEDSLAGGGRLNSPLASPTRDRAATVTGASAVVTSDFGVSRKEEKEKRNEKKVRKEEKEKASRHHNNKKNRPHSVSVAKPGSPSDLAHGKNNNNNTNESSGDPSGEKVSDEKARPKHRQNKTKDSKSTATGLSDDSPKRKMKKRDRLHEHTTSKANTPEKANVSESRQAVELAEKLEREREVAMEHRSLLRNKKKDRESGKLDATALQTQLAAQSFTKDVV